MKLVLEINLGNEAMQSYDDLSHAMQKVMQKMDTLWREDNEPQIGAQGYIRDENGNTVGEWQIVRGAAS